MPSRAGGRVDPAERFLVGACPERRGGSQGGCVRRGGRVQRAQRIFLSALPGDGDDAESGGGACRPCGALPRRRVPERGGAPRAGAFGGVSASSARSASAALCRCVLVRRRPPPAARRASVLLVRFGTSVDNGRTSSSGFITPIWIFRTRFRRTLLWGKRSLIWERLAAAKRTGMLVQQGSKQPAGSRSNDCRAKEGPVEFGNGSAPQLASAEPSGNCL